MQSVEISGLKEIQKKLEGYPEAMKKARRLCSRPRQGKNRTKRLCCRICNQRTGRRTRANARSVCSGNGQETQG